MNRKFIAKSNWVLRRVLNSKEQLPILKDFIETFLKIEIEDIRLNSYLENISKYLPSEENFGIADVRIKTKEKEELNVGIQFIDGLYVQNKLLLYYEQNHANKLENKEYNKIVKTITINILDFNYFNSKEYHKKIKIKENPLKQKNTNEIELHVLELPKYRYNSETEITREDAWMIYLLGKNQKLINKIKEKFIEIQKLDHLLEEYWKNEKME